MIRHIIIRLFWNKIYSNKFFWVGRFWVGSDGWWQTSIFLNVSLYLCTWKYYFRYQLYFCNRHPIYTHYVFFRKDFYFIFFNYCFSLLFKIYFNCFCSTFIITHLLYTWDDFSFIYVFSREFDQVKITKSLLTSQQFLDLIEVVFSHKSHLLHTPRFVLIFIQHKLFLETN